MFLQNNDLDIQYLYGWEEIRSALEYVEEVRREGKDAKIEITNSNADTILRITLRTIDELEKYFKSELRQMILHGAKEDLSSVVGKIVIP